MTSAVRIIINPAAGSGRAQAAWARHRVQAARLFSLEEVQTAHPGHATALAAEAAKAGVERVLVVGGDGTLNEVANGLAGTSTAMGALPVGTGNDFARAQGWMRPPAVHLAALAAGQIRPIDLGTVHGRNYLNVAGAGFDAEVARLVNAMATKASGTLPYLLTAIRQAFRYIPPELRVSLDGAPTAAARRCLLVAIGNSSAYGGGMRICPGAVVDDGALDVLQVGDVRRWRTLALLPKVFLGTHLGHPDIAFRRAPGVMVDGPPGVAVHADGEVVGELPAHFSVRPGALQLWTPA